MSVALQRFPAICLLGLLLLMTAQSRAEALHVQLPNGLPVNAEYLQGDKSRPAILVLHGFLQTFEFMSTRNIINGLVAQGYSVLAPNLSLGVPNRKQSAQCTAIHSHTLESDLQEIKFWIDWLTQVGHASVILIGHSWGSQHGLAYLDAHPDAAIKAVIAISLVRTHQTPAQTRAQIEQAEQRLATSDKGLHPYAMSFCKQYMATAQGYLSYARWDDDKVMAVLAKLQKHKLPVYAVLGGADKRIDAAWLEGLKQRVSQLAVVDGANHFFSHVHEFDLNDRLESILAELTEQAAQQ